MFFRGLQVALILAALAWWFDPSNPSVAVASSQGYQYQGYAIEAAKPYDMEARVLHRRDYSSGRESELSPVDLALGWGPMRRDDVLSEVQISQRNRFYFWRVDAFPIPRREIETHSANVHIIPASPEVEAQLTSVREDDVVRLKGQLVNVSARDGWQWRTSLSFKDTGAGACELLWLEHLEVI